MWKAEEQTAMQIRKNEKTKEPSLPPRPSREGLIEETDPSFAQSSTGLLYNGPFTGDAARAAIAAYVQNYLRRGATATTVTTHAVSHHA